MDFSTAAARRRRRMQVRSRASGVVWSVILIVAGTVFFLDNLNVFKAIDVLRFWPVVLIVAGVVKWSEERLLPGRLWGSFLIVAGVLLIASNLGFLRISFHTIWPLFLIGAGFFALIRSLSRGPGSPALQDAGSSAASPDDTLTSDVLQDVAVFGGVKRRVESRNFRGGEILSVFGGVELDMRTIQLPPDQQNAVLDIVATFGGVDLRIPEDWKVSVRGVAVFGAYEDKTLPPRPESASVNPELVITGHVIFGAVNIKN